MDIFPYIGMGNCCVCNEPPDEYYLGTDHRREPPFYWDNKKLPEKLFCYRLAQKPSQYEYESLCDL